MGNTAAGIGVALGGMANAMSMLDQSMDNKRKLAMQQQELDMQKQEMADKQEKLASAGLAKTWLDFAETAELDRGTAVMSLKGQRDAIIKMQSRLPGTKSNIDFNLLDNKNYNESLSNAAAGAAPAFKLIRENLRIGKDYKEGLTPEMQDRLKLYSKWTGEGWLKPILAEAEARAAAQQEAQTKEQQRRGLAANAGDQEHDTAMKRKTQEQYGDATGGLTVEAGAALTGPGTQNELKLKPGQENVPATEQKYAVTEKKDVAGLRMSKAQNNAFQEFTKSDAFGKDLLTQRNDAQKAQVMLSQSRNSKNPKEREKQIGAIMPAVQLQFAKAWNGGRPTEEDAKRLVFNPSYPDKIKRWISAGALGADMPKDVESMQILTEALVDYTNTKLKSGWENYARGVGRMYGADFDVDATLEGGNQAMGLDPVSSNRVDIKVQDEFGSLLVK